MTPVKVGKTSEIGEGAQKFIRIDGAGIYVSRVDGALYAAESHCPCPLSGGVLNRIVRIAGAPCVQCDAACYTLAFDLRTGANVRGFAFEVRVYPIGLEEDEVFIEIEGDGRLSSL